MPERHIIIHCGFPKTGSSALQVQLAQMRDQLLPLGYDYIPAADFALGKAGKIGSGNGVRLARAFLDPGHEASLSEEREQILQKHRGKIAQTDANAILSSEFFGALPVTAMADLVGRLSDLGKITLVFFVRDQLNFLASNYIQRVKRHGLQQFPEEFFQNWDSFKSSLSYHSMLSRLRDACPDVNIVVQAYEKSHNFPRGLLGLFFDMIGADVPDAVMPPDRPVNLSLSPKEVRLMIEINKHNPRMQFSDMVVESSIRAGRVQLYANHNILPPAFRKEVREFFRPENEAFFREFLGEDNSYGSRDEDADFVDLRQVSFDASDVVFIVGALLCDLDRRLARTEARTASLQNSLKAD